MHQELIILQKNNLEEYYSYKEVSNTVPVEFKNESYLYLDSEEFQNEFVRKREDSKEFKFFIEGIHCTACIWLLERLSEFNDKILSSQINLATNTLSIQFAGTELSKIAGLIQFLGYTPHPILNDQQEHAFRIKEDRKDLLRIGVAFACAGNIMLYSLAIYTGAEGNFAKYFNFFSFLCSLPVLSYSAFPLYKSALASIKSKNISIDIPISIALISGFCMGVVGLVTDHDIIYFDTLAVLVFLLSGSRYLLKKVQQKTIRSQDLTYVFQTSMARKILPSGKIEETLIKYLKAGDRVEVQPGAIIPADGRIVRGESSVNNSLISGESLPENVSVGSEVYTGAENISDVVEVEVEKTYLNSRIALILREIKDNSEETTTSQFARKLAQNFVWASLVLSSFFFIYFWFTFGPIVALERSLTLLVITCPCALGLTIPLAFIMGTSSFINEGIFIKGEATFEKLVNASKIFLDKTGTLSSGEFQVLTDLSSLKQTEINILYSLEKRSRHPIAKSIVRVCENLKATEVKIEDFREIPGVGICGNIGDNLYEVSQSNQGSEIENLVMVDFKKNGICLNSISLQDGIRENAREVINYLKSIDLSPTLLTGDKRRNASFVGKKLGIEEENILSEMKPEDKNEIIKNNPKCIMVGDGINDAMALKNAYVGIAVGGSADISLQAADIYMSKRGIEYLHQLFKGTRLVMYLIYFNILFSLLYNVIGVYITFTGMASPLFAAILMPLSSLTVLAMTMIFFIGLKKTLSKNMI